MKLFNVIILNIVVIITIGFLFYIVGTIKENIVNDSILKVEIISNISDVKQTTKLTERIIKIEEGVKRIGDINDKRFEILGWGFSVIFTIFALLIVINFVNSKATMRDLVYEELNNKNKDFNQEYSLLIKEIKDKRDQLQKEIDEFEL